MRADEHQLVSGNGERVRLDKWLWAARFFKTRSLATEAVDGGRVVVNGERAKPARTVNPGDLLAIRIGPYAWTVTVTGLSSRRGPATEARTLYTESDKSRLAREEAVARIRAAQPLNPLHKGRPTKRDRRELDRLRDEGDGDGNPED
jgi:ribosome-associated heat shock protein Hsp15